jgi:hypothetical protein
MITSATAARNETYAGTNRQIYAWGAQVEAGAFATSYIPTVASQVTRSADSAVMTGTNFSSWYNASEGTFYCEAATVDIVSNKGIWSVGDASLAFANRTKIFMNLN